MYMHGFIERYILWDLVRTSHADLITGDTALMAEQLYVRLLGWA